MNESQKKTQLLFQEFTKLNIQVDQRIEDQIIKDFLDDKINGKFDEQVFFQLAQHTRIKQGYVSIKGFIQSILDAEEILLRKINKTKDQLINQEQLVQETNKSLERKMDQENSNQFGVMDDSFITFNLIKAEIKGIENIQIYALVSCDQNSYQTQVVDDTWDQQYNFPIQSGHEKINIVIKGHKGNQTIKIGECQVSVQEFANQKNRKLNVTLKCQEPYSGVLYVSGIWIFSKVIYYRDLLAKQNTELAQLEETLEDYISDLNILYGPFPYLQSSEAPSPMILRSPQQTIIDQFENWELITITKYILSFLSLLIALCSLNRCMYLDILIITAFFYKFYLNELDPEFLKMIAVTTFCSFCLDILWITIFLSPLWSDIYTAEVGIDKLVVITSVLIFGTKLIFSFLCFCLSKKSSDEPQSEISQLQNFASPKDSNASFQK